MGKLFEAFAGKGVYLLHIMPGENDAILRDYQKHYRCRWPAAGDPDYAIVSRYQARAWPTGVIVDRGGRIRFQQKIPSREVATIERLLTDLSRGESPSGHESGGLTYPGKKTPDETDFRPPSPALTIDSNGNPCVAFVRGTAEGSDLVLRRFKAGKFSREIVIVSGRDDKLDPAIAAGEDGKLWVAWVSNVVRRYDIYASEVGAASAAMRERVTASPDDAFHPRMVIDKDGALWVTYYEWRRHDGVSRDREVFVRCRANGAWQDARQVSPSDVPWYEDHTDPAIAMDAIGRKWIFWSWDYHPPKAGGRYRARSPSIFCRWVEKEIMGEVEAVGEQDRSIDMWPTAARDAGGTLWCVWDRAGGKYPAGMKRQPAVSVLRGEGFSTVTPIPCDVSLSGSPMIAAWGRGKACVVWCAPSGRRRHVFRSTYDGKGWTPPRTVALEHDPWFPVIAADAEGTVWMAYSARTKDGWDVFLRKL